MKRCGAGHVSCQHHALRLSVDLLVLLRLSISSSSRILLTQFEDIFGRQEVAADMKSREMSQIPTIYHHNNQTQDTLIHEILIPN